MPHSHQESDATLLTDFAIRRDENAFASLVDRYADMVYGTALRKCGSVEIAEEACQNVFVLLARKADSIRSAKALGVWLHRAVLLESRRLLRKESNYRRKMKRYADNFESESQTKEPEWNPMLPLLDDAINKLSESDRRMIVWRFFEGRTFKEIGAGVGESDDTCQKRTSRALEKLGRSLQTVRGGPTSHRNRCRADRADGQGSFGHLEERSNKVRYAGGSLGIFPNNKPNLHHESDALEANSRACGRFGNPTWTAMVTESITGGAYRVGKRGEF